VLLIIYKPLYSLSSHYTGGHYSPHTLVNNVLISKRPCRRVHFRPNYVYFIFMFCFKCWGLVFGCLVWWVISESSHYRLTEFARQ